MYFEAGSKRRFSHAGLPGYLDCEGNGLALGLLQEATGRCNTLNSSRLTNLLAHDVHDAGLAANAEMRSFTVGAFLQHLAMREDLSAQSLRRPGQE